MTGQKAEEALSNAGRLLRSLADASLDAIYIKDRNSRWLFANPALERIAGKPVSELLGKTDAEIYSPPDIGRAILGHDKKILESGKPETFEEYVDLPDGRHFFISVKSPIFDEYGNPTGLVGISHDITARKRREERLRASEKKYKDLIETTNDFVWEVDPDGRYTYCSPQMERLWKLKPEEMLGKTPFDQMPSEAKKEGMKFYKSVVDSKIPFSGLQVPSFDGQGNLIFIEISGVPFFDDKGQLLGYRGITRDITDRKKTEEALRESEEKFKRLVRTSPAGIFEIELSTGRFTEVNDIVCNILGYAREEFLVMNAFDILDEEGRVRFIARTKLGPDKDPNDAEEYRVYRKDGSYIWALVNATYRRGENGAAKANVIAYDITERKKAEAALLGSEKKFRDAFESSPIDMALIGLDGSFIDLNNAAVQMHGFSSKQELLEKNCFELVDKQYHKTVVDAFATAIERGSVNDIELVQLKKDGQKINTLASATVLFDSEGKPTAYLAMVKDITERKKTEEALIQRNRELEDLQVKLEEKAAEVEEYANNMEALAQERLAKLKDAERLAAIGATAGMVGHDIRNPLQSISGDIYLALKDLMDLPDSEQKQGIKESLDGISMSVNYINKIVQDLQDYARPLNPVPDEVNLRNLCEDVLLRNPMPGNIRGSCRVDEDAKQIVTDPEMLKRVINNLVTNAVQAMPKGGKLSINAHREGNDTVIEISDTGGGIPEDVKPKLFTPLFTTKSKGQGFGLATVKRVAEALSGTITFESEPGKGTKFIIRLPPPEAENGRWIYKK